MKALVVENREIRLKKVQDPVPGPGEALIKVLKAGICNTDLEILKGYMEFSGILGHEFVGLVEDAPQKEWIGQRVVGEINLFCGACEFCVRGETKHCPFRTVLGISGKNGALAEYLALPVQILHILPKNVSVNEGVFTEPLAAAIEVLKQFKNIRDERVLVLGDGKLGVLIAQVLALESDAVVCMGKHERNLAILERNGIRTYMKGDDLDPGFPLVVEATGNEDGLKTALQMVAPTGIVVLKSTYRDAPTIDIAKVVVDEIHLIGSRCGSLSEAISYLTHKRIDVANIIDGDFPLDRAMEAFEHARKPGALKILLTP
ncbi:MAG: alcohol dehydrogenase catalytic domain-containing protein [Candidatus Aminicenantes bacterium]